MFSPKLDYAIFAGFVANTLGVLVRGLQNARSLRLQPAGRSWENELLGLFMLAGMIQMEDDSIGDS